MSWIILKSYCFKANCVWYKYSITSSFPPDAPHKIPDVPCPFAIEIPTGWPIKYLIFCCHGIVITPSNTSYCNLKNGCLYCSNVNENTSLFCYYSVNVFLLNSDLQKTSANLEKGCALFIIFSARLCNNTNGKYVKIRKVKWGIYFKRA